MAVSSYKNYETAAKRHIATCTGLIEWLKLNKGNSNKAKQREDVLKDLYYLSGYIIECIYSYAVFEYMKNNPVTVSSTNQQPIFPDNIPVTRFDKPPYQTIRNEHKVTYKYDTLQTHRIARNNPAHTFVNDGGITFFEDKTIDKNIPAIKNEPLSGSRLLLFEAWNAEIRYEIPTNLALIIDKPNVLDFCKLAAEIYIGLQVHILGKPINHFSKSEILLLDILKKGY